VLAGPHALPFPRSQTEAGDPGALSTIDCWGRIAARLRGRRGPGWRLSIFLRAPCSPFPFRDYQGAARRLWFMRLAPMMMLMARGRKPEDGRRATAFAILSADRGLSLSFLIPLESGGGAGASIDASAIYSSPVLRVWDCCDRSAVSPREGPLIAVIAVGLACGC